MTSTVSKFLKSQKVDEQYFSKVREEKLRNEENNATIMKASSHFLKNIYKAKSFQNRMKEEEIEKIKRDKPYLYANKYL